ncbi:MAG: thiamine pyrophosphate-dependent enzyme [Nanoarchaeota archaeon]|nr:thiamine pyrophosphate-dependent enzyme [Nanoarchaeota archaeon]
MCANNSPIKIVILNNNCLGMFRQFQDSYFDSCCQSTVFEYNAPDFTKLVLAYNIELYLIRMSKETEKGLVSLCGNPL